ncbi:hypothetical protein L593_10625 [Salinarchaeum sp. Harcht-Bsk1]|nr:hypothetical protein L593_10625 [Salinarchaeum sp. Harcht-Bsk1]
MLAVLRSRALLLVVCAAIGVGMAFAGTSVGATGALTTDSTGPKFVVSDENVTFRHAGGHETVVQNVSDLERIEFEQAEDGTFQINTERVQPFTAAERETAVAVARDNASVQQAMAELGDYEFSVEPIRKLTVNENFSINATPTDEHEDAMTGNATSETFVIESDQEGTVTVDREPEYVEDEAVVRIADENDDTQYSVVVDLEEEIVVDGIDWESE